MGLFGNRKSRNNVLSIIGFQKGGPADRILGTALGGAGDIMSGVGTGVKYGLPGAIGAYTGASPGQIAAGGAAVALGESDVINRAADSMGSSMKYVIPVVIGIGGLYVLISVAKK